MHSHTRNLPASSPQSREVPINTDEMMVRVQHERARQCWCRRGDCAADDAERCGLGGCLWYAGTARWQRTRLGGAKRPVYPQCPLGSETSTCRLTTTRLGKARQIGSINRHQAAAMNIHFANTSSRFCSSLFHVICCIFVQFYSLFN